MPLVNPVVLQGGIFDEGHASSAAENGETLCKTPQPVPGGCWGSRRRNGGRVGLQSWFNNLINEGFTGVNATVELAGPASRIEVNLVNLLFEKGTAISLPVKIKLSNAILGSNCYLGSDSSPIVIDFTSGETSPPPPNEPIHGAPGRRKTTKPGRYSRSAEGRSSTTPTRLRARTGAAGCSPSSSTRWSTRSSACPRRRGPTPRCWKESCSSAVAAAVKASEE